MNERIKQLVEQAQYYANEQNDKHGVSWIRTYNEKFAELIVRECAGICEKDGRWWAEKGYLMEAGEAGSLATQIKQHFGVEK